MEFIQEYFPILLPIVLLEIGLMLYSLRHILLNDKFRIGNKMMWILIVVFIQIFGPILYFTIGKESE